MVEISIDKIASTIEQELTQYHKNVQEGIDKATDKVVKDGLRELKSTSPEKTGKYRKGWKDKKESHLGETSHSIYNAAKPGLTHLTEFGHALRNGGRTKAQPHIAPVEAKMIAEYQKAVEEVIKNG